MPNEIYLIILEHIAPTSTRLYSEQFLTLSNLSRVCRFFANLCLPRIFEYLSFFGFATGNNAFHMDSRARILCQHIAAKQPLALSLAHCVKVCHFTGFGNFNESVWAVYRGLYNSGMPHMKNLRELKFSRSIVKKVHWDAVATLESLEILDFSVCTFVDGPADVDPDKRLTVKVPCLSVHGCNGYPQLLAAIDTRHLRTLTMDLEFADHVDWLSETALIELRVYDYDIKRLTMASPTRVKRLLCQMPQSIQVLRLPFRTFSEIDESLFVDPAWKTMPLLRSLTLEVGRGPDIAPMTVSLSALV
jgi:hypothetical protein